MGKLTFNGKQETIHVLTEVQKMNDAGDELNSRLNSLLDSHKKLVTMHGILKEHSNNLAGEVSYNHSYLLDKIETNIRNITSSIEEMQNSIDSKFSSLSGSLNSLGQSSGEGLVQLGNDLNSKNEELKYQLDGLLKSHEDSHSNLKNKLYSLKNDGENNHSSAIKLTENLEKNFIEFKNDVSDDFNLVDIFQNEITLDLTKSWLYLKCFIAFNFVQFIAIIYLLCRK